MKQLASTQHHLSNLHTFDRIFVKARGVILFPEEKIGIEAVINTLVTSPHSRGDYFKLEKK